MFIVIRGFVASKLWHTALKREQNVSDCTICLSHFKPGEFIMSRIFFILNCQFTIIHDYINIWKMDKLRLCNEQVFCTLSSSHYLYLAIETIMDFFFKFFFRDRRQREEFIQLLAYNRQGLEISFRIFQMKKKIINNVYYLLCKFRLEDLRSVSNVP